jgi:type IV pilus assembly protein PilP
MMKTHVAIFVLGFSLGGCASGEFADLKQFVEESGNGLVGRVEPIPEMKPYEPFSYAALDLPDPFKPRKLEPAKGGGGGLQPDLARRKELLESYPLENLKMVGTLNQGKAFYALVRTPDNLLARVKTGNYLGQNFGQVLQISESEVKLKELIQDTAGDWSERLSTLQLQEEQEKAK